MGADDEGMALHDRLRPPTLEPPAHAGHVLPVALVLVVLAAGFAYAMPRAYSTSAEGGGTAEPEVIVTPTPTPTATATPDPELTETLDDEAEEGTKADNHGRAVSTAAHCDIRGKAHGELVRSIAKDKEATVADAEAACTAAIAAQEVAPDEEHGKPGHADKVREKVHSVPPGHAEGHGKPDKTKP